MHVVLLRAGLERCSQADTVTVVRQILLAKLGNPGSAEDVFKKFLSPVECNIRPLVQVQLCITRAQSNQVQKTWFLGTPRPFSTISGETREVASKRTHDDHVMTKSLDVYARFFKNIRKFDSSDPGTANKNDKRLVKTRKT